MKIPPYAITPPSCGTIPQNASRRARLMLRMSHDVIDCLAPWATCLQYPPSREIIAQGDDATFCYVITSGSARMVCFLEDGRRQVLAFLSPGDLVGWEAVGWHKVGAEAITAVRALRLVSADLDALAEREPVVGRWLRMVSALKLRASSEHLAALGCLSARERIAHFLLAMHKRTGTLANAEIVLPMVRRDIADYLGLTSETICRCLTKYERDGVLRLKDGWIAILDREALELAGAGLSL